HERIASLQMLTQAERKQILGDWNETQLDYPREACLGQLLAAQAQRSPDATAVGFEDQSWTWRGLDDRAGRLASPLKSLGVGPDVLVGICVERSLETVAAMLGVLKAGGAYVPLDPLYPAERLAHMISDSQMPALVTQRHFAANLPQGPKRVFIEDID